MRLTRQPKRLRYRKPEQEHPYSPPIPRPVTRQERDEWLDSTRERHTWDEVDQVLDTLADDGWGLRVRAIRRQLRWLRREAFKLGYKWGRKED